MTYCTTAKVTIGEHRGIIILKTDFRKFITQLPPIVCLKLVHIRLSLEGLKTPGLVLSTAVLARGTGMLPNLLPPLDVPAPLPRPGNNSHIQLKMLEISSHLWNLCVLYFFLFIYYIS